MTGSDIHPKYPAKYFKETRPPLKGVRHVFKLGSAFSYVVLHTDGRQELVNANKLKERLGLGKSDSRVDLFFCRNRATAVRESGDTESWIEYPTGKAVRISES